VVAAQTIAALAAARAPESERARRLSADVVQALSEADLFRLCVPASIGGLEAEPATLVAAIEALARGDGAAGWCLAVSATSGLLGGYLPDEVAREVYGRHGTMVGGVFAPRGSAEPSGDGYQVSGRWPMASGCEHCDWLMGGCLVGEAGVQRRLASGAPEVRLMLAPAAQVQVIDTWHVAGLRGTGSHDIAFDGLSIPGSRSVSVFGDQPLSPGPLYKFPLFGLLAIAIAGVSLGLGRGALDDLIELSHTKVPAGGRRSLAERPTVQAELARAQAQLRGARALLNETVAHAWEQAQGSGPIDIDARAALRLAATHAGAVGSEVCHTAHRLAGASAIYDSSPVQRRLRDAQVATQHMLIAPATWELTGRLLLGLDTDVTQL